MIQELSGKVALVTGSSRNIGRAIALDLAVAGASIVLNARTISDEVKAVAAELQSRGTRALISAADVSDPISVKSMIGEAVTAFGGIDILVCNAAIRRETPFEQLDFSSWREVTSIILDGAYLCVHAALPYLKASDAGSVVLIGGMSAHTGSKGRAHVVAAKAGLVGLTHALAHDLGSEGINVNCVVPGMIDTTRLAQSASGGEPSHHAQHRSLVGRRGRPDEVAAAVRYLVGSSGRYITGQSLHVNGGAYLT